jgi:hypothetical protein
VCRNQFTFAFRTLCSPFCDCTVFFFENEVSRECDLVLPPSDSIIVCTKQSHPWDWVSGLDRNFNTVALLDRYLQSPSNFSLPTNSRLRNFFGILSVALQYTRADVHDYYITLLLFTPRASSYCYLVSFTKIPAWKLNGERIRSANCKPCH